MSTFTRRFKKSAIGASSVTLVPSTLAPGINSPQGALQTVQQIVVSTNGVTPPAAFWGTTTTDGREYTVTIETENG